MPPSDCVIVTPLVPGVPVAGEAGLRELGRRGYQLWRVQFPSAGVNRPAVAAEAAKAGFRDLFWIDPDIVFDPDDVARLLAHPVPLVCALYPVPGRRTFACDFMPGTASVVFGREGRLTEVRAAGLGFALVRRAAYDAARAAPPGPAEPDPDFAFCAAASRAGIRVMADTAVRVSRVGPYAYSWEDAGKDPDRFHTYTFFLPLPAGAAAPAAPTPPPPAPPGTPIPVPRNPLRGEARPLPAGFPRLAAYVVTYPGNRDSLARTLEGLRQSDWGEEPVVVMQPEGETPGREAGTRNYKRALERATADGCDFALVLEDDVTVCRHLRQNLLTLPLVARDQCDYLSLFLPDLIADPWDRAEPHLGYRVAKPRYTGPNALWEKHRLWGTQGCLFSGRFVRDAVARWDSLGEANDARVLGVCAANRFTPYYTAPCLVEHAPLRSSVGTPPTYAPDFDPEFRLAIGPGFQPPEAIPGGVTVAEGKCLWELAAGRDVLELGTGAGRATVCLAQQARRVVTVDVADQAEAGEWARRYGVADRVEFRRGDVTAVCAELGDRFGLVFVDTESDAASVTRDVEAVLPRLEPGGLVAFHDYPDPARPEVRRVADGYAGRLGWKRVAQVGYLGVFRT